MYGDSRFKPFLHEAYYRRELGRVNTSCLELEINKWFKKIYKSTFISQEKSSSLES